MWRALKVTEVESEILELGICFLDGQLSSRRNWKACSPSGFWIKACTSFPVPTHLLICVCLLIKCACGGSKKHDILFSLFHSHTETVSILFYYFLQLIMGFNTNCIRWKEGIPPTFFLGFWLSLILSVNAAGLRVHNEKFCLIDCLVFEVHFALFGYLITPLWQIFWRNFLWLLDHNIAFWYKMISGIFSTNIYDNYFSKFQCSLGCEKEMKLCGLHNF